MAFLTDLWDAFEEFLENLIHTFAYVRDIYPRDTFTYVRHYGMAVPHSNHPGVQKWASEAAHDAMAAIRTSTEKRKLSLVAMDDITPFERLVLDTSHFPGPGNDFETVEIDIDRLRAQHRSCLVALMTRNTVRSSEPSDNRSMTLIFEGDPPEDSEVWMQAQNRPPEKPSLLPVRFIEAGSFSMAIFRQEFKNNVFQNEEER